MGEQKAQEHRTRGGNGDSLGRGLESLLGSQDTTRHRASRTAAETPQQDTSEAAVYRAPQVGDELFFVLNPADGPTVYASRPSITVNPAPRSVLSAAGSVASAAVAATVVVAACTIAGVSAVASIIVKGRQ